VTGATEKARRLNGDPEPELAGKSVIGSFLFESFRKRGIKIDNKELGHLPRPERLRLELGERCPDGLSTKLVAVDDTKAMSDALLHRHDA
jgi:hypothetical protein